MDLVFLDANILFSASYSQNTKLLQFWNLKNIKLITSSYALNETFRNLNTQKQKIQLKKLVSKISLIEFLPIVNISPKIELKEKDIPILKAAIFAKATHLITGDKKDFGTYFNKTIQGVLILPPADYLKNKVTI